MAPTKEATKETAVKFDLSKFAEPKRYAWREIERDDPSDEPLRVRLRILSVRQVNAIPWGADVTLQAALDASAEYVVDWNVQAEDLRTGELVDVPPPSEVGSVVFELLPMSETRTILRWLRSRDAMLAMAKVAEQAAASQAEKSN